MQPLDLFLSVQIPNRAFVGILIVGSFVMFMCCVAIIWFVVYNNRQRQLAEQKLLASRMAEAEQTIQRISDALHDHLHNQLSFACKLLGDQINSEQRREAVSIRMITTARNLVLDSLAHLRNVGLLLDGKRIIGLGLPNAIKRELAYHQSLSDITIHYSSDGAPTTLLAEDVAIHLYRIFQEALGNALKHAKASQITVVLREHPRYQVELVIQDNGIGFLPHSVANPTSRGLDNIRTRAAAIGAKLTIDTAPGCGTAIHVNLPLPHATRTESS